MESLPPPPYTPREDPTPSLSPEATPIAHQILLENDNDNDNGPSHDYSAYEQVLPETDPDLPDPDEPLPAYHPRSHRTDADRNLDLPDVPHYSAVSVAPCGRPTRPGVSRVSVPSTAWTARAPTSPAPLARESSPSGVSPLQRIIDLTKQLSERSADQVARSVRAGLTPRRDQHRRQAPIRTTSSSSSLSLEDPLSGQDFRALDDLDLTTLRISIANLMRNPGNQDEILQAVSQLRDDLNNRRDQTVPKQQVKDFRAEVLANRKKVRAMREEAKAAKKAEDKERKREKRAERRARNPGSRTGSRESGWFSPV